MPHQHIIHIVLVKTLLVFKTFCHGNSASKVILDLLEGLVVCKVSCYIKVGDLFLSLNSDDDLGGSKETIR